MNNQQCILKTNELKLMLIEREALQPKTLKNIKKLMKQIDDIQCDYRMLRAERNPIRCIAFLDEGAS